MDRVKCHNMCSVTQRQFSLKKFLSDGIIGSGKHSVFYKGSFGATKSVAVRQIKVESVEQAKQVQIERDVLAGLRHPRICQLVAAFTDRNALLVLEYCVGNVRSLNDLITPLDATRYAVHMLEGLQFLHSCGWWHGNLTPKKCLITPRNTLVLSDFRNVMNDNIKDSIVLPGERSTCYKRVHDKDKLTVESFKDLFAAACLISFMATKEIPSLCKYEPPSVFQIIYASKALRTAQEKDIRTDHYKYDSASSNFPLSLLSRDMIYFTFPSASQILSSRRLADILRIRNLELHDVDKGVTKVPDLYAEQPITCHASGLPRKPKSKPGVPAFKKIFPGFYYDRQQPCKPPLRPDNIENALALQTLIGLELLQLFQLQKKMVSRNPGRLDLLQNHIMSCKALLTSTATFF